ncbi:MAG: hypothetical protein KJ686_05140 [Actinobacteria bacterium]|nr:hypothetical protein [Actinomycetota bacterium]
MAKKKVELSVEELRKQILDPIEDLVSKALNSVGVATTKDIEDLDKRMTAIEKQLTSKPAKRKAPAKKKPRKKAAGKKKAPAKK